MNKKKIIKGFFLLLLIYLIIGFNMAWSTAFSGVKYVIEDSFIYIGILGGWMFILIFYNLVFFYIFSFFINYNKFTKKKNGEIQTAGSLKSLKRAEMGIMGTKQEIKEAEKYIKTLSDTDLFIGIATSLAEILSKLPLPIKMNMLHDEVLCAEISLKEVHRRINKSSQKDWEKS